MIKKILKLFCLFSNSQCCHCKGHQRYGTKLIWICQFLQLPKVGKGEQQNVASNPERYLNKISNFLSSFVFFGIFIGSIPISVLADATSTKNFQDALQYAGSLTGAAEKAIVKSKFVPEEVFKDQKGGYTETPPQMNYYQGVGQNDAQDMEKTARAEVAKDEDYKNANGEVVPNFGKAVVTGFSTREVFKISPNDDFIKKGKLVVDNAQNVVTGASNQDIDCEQQKMSLAEYKAELTFETCNEEVRTIQRICKKIPIVTMVMKDFVYPDCQNVVVTQGAYVGCPAGYSEILNSDMIKKATWDDIRLCKKTVTTNEGECYRGYLIQCSYPNSWTRRVLSTERAIIPMKTHGHIKFSSTYDGSMTVSIFNETTNQVVFNARSFSAGQVIDLPFSETQDQTFRYSTHGGLGVMILYFDRIYKDAVPDMVWSEDMECYEI